MDHRAPPVGRVVDALDKAATLKAIEDAGHRAGRQIGRLGQPAGRQPRLGDDQLEAAQVGGVHAQPFGQGVFVGRIAQDLTDAI